MTTCIIIPSIQQNRIILERCVDSIIKYVREDYIILVEINDFEGFGITVNRGIRKGLKFKDIDGVIIGNDDMIVTEEGCITEMKEITQGNNGVAVPPSLHRGTHVAMGWCYFPRKVLEDIGNFDERYKILEWEDVDMSVRLQEKGYRLNELSKEYVLHQNGKARAQFNPEQVRLMQNNKQIFKRKWKGTKWEKTFR